MKTVRQYADFNGRARRKEYWMFTGVCTLIMIGILAFGGLAVATDSHAMRFVTLTLFVIFFLALQPGDTNQHVGQPIGVHLIAQLVGAQRGPEPVVVPVDGAGGVRGHRPVPVRAVLAPRHIRVAPRTG